jgi:hypothetical protein
MKNNRKIFKDLNKFYLLNNFNELQWPLYLSFFTRGSEDENCDQQGSYFDSI